MAAHGKPMIVIGIGASAGGLEAVSALIHDLDAKLPACYVVLQHLSPTHKSMMPEILARGTNLSVMSLQRSTKPRSGTIYVVPPNSNAIYQDGRIELTPVKPEISPKPSVNMFFKTLAEEMGDRAIGVVLSGTGSDGTLGLRAIQAEGGVTIVQDPATAKYAGMPQSAIDAGCADFVLTPAAIAAQMPEFIRMHLSDDNSISEQVLERVVELLKERKQLDFSGYKTGTMARRIQRRIVATGAGRVKDYLHLLQEHATELDELARDILISVTSFFRDKEAFESFNGLLKQHLQQHQQQELRIWIAGCATGEEAYSVAMLAAEALQHLDQPPGVVIFATDLDEEALRIARRGVYPTGALADIPPRLLERYFKPYNDQFEVSKKLRDMVVFAKHNLVSDPPFMRVDFITCRNVLIYFSPQLQRKVLQRFHFALANDGVLFLGRSESISHAEEFFSVSHRRDRLYSKSPEVTVTPELTQAPTSAKPNSSNLMKVDAEQLLHHLHHWLRNVPAAAVVCQADGMVLRALGRVDRFFKQGPAAERLTDLPLAAVELQQPLSDVGLNAIAKALQGLALKDIIHPRFRTELGNLLSNYDWTAERMLGQTHHVAGEHWQLMVMPLAHAQTKLFMVTVLPAFMPNAREQAQELTRNSAATQQLLQDELFATREHLQAMVEELASSNEEMQSLNEEMQASNEEMQATNEELEAANEELQATNEELISLNQELNVKTAELIALNDEYAHVYDALEFPLLVFDTDGKLLRYNAAAQRRLALRGNMIGRDFAKLKLPHFIQNDAIKLFEQAYSEGDTAQHVVRGQQEVVQVTVTPGLNRRGDVYAVLVTLIDVTEITRTQEQLQASQHQLAQIMENTTMILALKSLNGEYSLINPSFESMFNLTADDVLGRTDFDLFPHDFAASMLECDLRTVRSLKSVTHEHHLNNQQGQQVYRTVHQALLNEQGKAYAILIEAEDITLRKKAEQQLQIAARVYEQAGEAIVVMDQQGLIQTVNSAFEHLTQLVEADALESCFWNLVYCERDAEKAVQRITTELSQTGFWQGEVSLMQQGDEAASSVAVWLTINRIQSPELDRSAYVAVFADISNLKESQRKAEYLATHDSLTALPNRTLLQDRLGHAIDVAKRDKSAVALLFIDLDNFKNLNDTLGHDAGDELLIQAAERLKAVVREVDTVARLGGDEFTIVLGDATLGAAERVARQALEVLSQPFVIQRHRHYMSGSIGIALYPDDGVDTTTLIKAADTAMYRAKDNGRNRYELYKEELQSQLLRHADVENKLREALRRGDLYLAYQPKFKVAEPNLIVGAEALLRWHHDELGQVSPADFIAVAEQSNLIVDVDFYVASELIRQLAKWQQQGIDYPAMALNVSPKSFQHEGYVDLILRLLEQYKVHSLMIQIELTERTLVSQRNSELGNIERLRNAGIQLSIDDFGTGYSSMSYLKRLPLAELKIDKSFVDGLAQEANDEAIAKAILAMAQALDIRTVAEGVETKEQLDWLATYGCDYAQGYLLAKPMSADDFVKLLKGSK
ncbi:MULTISPECIES: EAL domain-containing protein [Idiomarina]|uniref:EAL domain-containing protein n=1 Tax=Idiomarina TaxID=135575 RepID=UPI00129CC679|nr:MULTISPECIES: EAL domain-containing protein [Idiomarina]MRJ42661.1 EAL domain-containing protein [Idiomarina sp. FeN1]NCU57919.1 EAL domain-containing protein [Idiomarina sp. FenA--70]NCU60471.1 EAL domain-containing protein [Idiomarina sp. FenBw--71]UUN13562.1 EAL domain-containing protein [Idiomarina loihiensis]